MKRVSPDEDCGGCIGRKGNAGVNWHRARGQEPCNNAREASRLYYEERRRAKAEAEGRSYILRSPAGTGRVKRRPQWTPGTPILVEEFEEL